MCWAFGSAIVVCGSGGSGTAFCGGVVAKAADVVDGDKSAHLRTSSAVLTYSALSMRASMFYVHREKFAGF